MKRTEYTLIFLAILGATNCWHGTGHYLVAYIAQAELIKSGPEALKWCNDLLLPYVQYCGENLYPFVEAATWADKVKDQGWFTQSTSHFFDTFLFLDESIPKITADPSTNNNVVFGINDSIGTLSSKKSDKFGSSKSVLGKSLSLRNLIHFLGDIHQPLHTGALVDKENPKGDQGGNLFPIKHYPEAFFNNLHFIWDDMFFAREYDIRSNLTPELYKKVENMAIDFTTALPRNKLTDKLATNATAKSWAEEGFEIVKNTVYPGVVKNADLTKEYQDKAREICKERVVLAGYRLADTILAAYNSFKK